MITPGQFELLLPRAVSWIEHQEERITRAGLPLSAVGLADARRIGLQQPDRVRLLRVDSVPLPDDPILRNVAITVGLITPETRGLTARYGIFIRDQDWDDRQLIAHELVHTFQYERLGGIKEFLEPYIHECFTIGYPHGPLEQEAIRTASQICAES